MARSTINGKGGTGKASVATLRSRSMSAENGGVSAFRATRDGHEIFASRGGEEFASSALLEPEAPAFDKGISQPSNTQTKKDKRVERDWRRVNIDNWISRGGHTFTYAGLFLFTFTLYFRPYELIPGLSGFTFLAFIIAVATLIIYLPTQLAAEGSVTALPVEVKCVLFLTFWALITIPIAKDVGVAWDKFNEHFSKVAIIFVVMVNTVRTAARIRALMWLGIGIGVLLSFQAVNLYREGVFKVEGYRVGVDFGGMFGNPNDMAIHLVIFVPISIALGLATKNKIAKLVYFISAAVMTAGIMVTQSRGGILGLLVAAFVLSWQVGRGQRTKVIAISSVVAVAAMLFAPGNLGLRILSIFIPALDPVGSSDQRKDLLIQSIWVTLRNPLGIGIGNFPVVGNRSLETHNAYTEVSSELGWLAFAAYMIFLISPLRKLSAVQRLTAGDNENSWIYYVSIGVYASIAGYMVSSFFGAVAYNWYIYYPVAYAVCLRRIYQLQAAERDGESKLGLHTRPEVQTA